ncbi:hypothetical protein H8E65_01080 [Candidatus Bathyarchaeota archaeon]|nr:hypothetical protein [Candidatus Bathyarchaeota archaeon]MBL7080095.1 hypothetical protein [Candidatus Bathyarchaeota archaeon]
MAPRDGEEPPFNRAELYPNETVLEDIIRHAGILKNRADLNLGLLHRLSGILNNQGFRIFLFILENGPATDKQLRLFFPRRTLSYWLEPLEAGEVIVKHDHRWRIRI